MQKLEVSQFKEVKKHDIDNDVLDIVDQARKGHQVPKDTIIIKNARCKPNTSVKSGIVMLLATFYYSQCLKYEQNQDNDDREQQNWERFKSQQEMFKRMKNGQMLLTIQKNLPFFNRNQKLTYDFLDFYRQQKLIDLLETFSQKTIEVTYISIRQEGKMVQNQEEIQFVSKTIKKISCQPKERCFHFIICNLLTSDQSETFMFLSQLKTQQQIKKILGKKQKEGSGIPSEKIDDAKPNQGKIIQPKPQDPRSQIQPGVRQQKEKQSIDSMLIFIFFILLVTYVYMLLKVTYLDSNHTQVDNNLFSGQSNSPYTKPRLQYV